MHDQKPVMKFWVTYLFILAVCGVLAVLGLIAVLS
jgi:hypothetical protein